MQTAAEETDRDRRAILLAVCLAALVLPLSFSGGAVATPAIGAALGGSPAALNWITNSFMLTFGSSLMAAGSLADRYGRRLVFLTGTAAFALFSAALSLAPSLLVLNALRAGQGFAAAAALAGGTAALAQTFDGPARTRAFSLLGTTFGLGLAFGPLLAGTLIAACGWRATFLSGLVIGAIALLLVARRMPESSDPAARGVDWPGILSFTAALTLFTFGIIAAPADGWTSGPVLAALLTAGLMLALFVGIELKSARPMLDLTLFAYPRFLGVQVLPVATCYCYVVLLVLLPLRFIGVGGETAIGAGLLLIALSAPMLIVPLTAAWLVRWVSAGMLSGIGLVLAAIGLYWLGRVDPMAGALHAVPPMLLIGVGTGLPWGLMDGLSISVVPKERAGMATGIFSTTRVAGEGVALAVVNAVLAWLARGQLAAALPNGDAGLSVAAGRLAAGDIQAAAAALPELSRAELAATYASVFQQLTLGLVGITLVSAVIVTILLGTPFRRRRAERRCAPAE